ncbi:hypothetical protein ACFYS8_23735 [Kitasatospora sp. NPDC004615]|uniref:hypothetical protein n=1 Tax=Kitasatospora sp. NPDC004615 TaxID=3364017 RepID=UPI00367BCE88
MLDGTAASPLNTYMPSSDFCELEQIPRPLMDEILGVLGGAGDIEVARRTGGGLPLVRFTAQGLGKARYHDILRSDRVARALHAREEILDWAFKGGDAGNSPSVQGFRLSDASFYYGDALSVQEIEFALECLESKGLVKPGWNERLSLTPGGFDCVIGGGNMAQNADRSRDRGDSYNFHGPVHGAQIGGMNNTQTNNFGVEPEALVTWAQQLRQLSPQVGLDEILEAELVSEVEILESANSVSPPQPSRLRRAGNRIMEILQSSPDSPIGQLLITGGTAAISAAFAG